MSESRALARADLPRGTKKAVTLGGKKILLVHTDEGKLYAVEAECPHAKAPLEDGAVCNGRLVCPWHAGTFELETGAVVEPPPLRALHTYSLRADADSIWVVAEEPWVRRHETTGHVVTLGAGAAAVALATTLRREGFVGRITAVDPVASEPIDRTVLTKMALSREMTTKDAAIDAPFTRVRSKAVSLDARARRVWLQNGESIGFDFALVCTGGAPRSLGIRGERLPHVRTIRHAEDIEGLHGDHAVIVGDSFIAFEAASALVARGMHVTVLARSKHPFEQLIGRDAAAALLALHRRHGVVVQLEAEATQITPDAVLTSTQTLPADLVIVAIGVTPKLDFEHALYTRADGTASVTRDLKSKDAVWVAGDVATVDGVHLEHWRVAEQHGQVAAYGMLRELGAPVPLERALYHGVPFFWTLHFGQRWGHVGHAPEWDRIVTDGDPAAGDFVSYYVKDGLVLAALGCTRDEQIAWLAERLREPLRLEELTRPAGSPHCPPPSATAAPHPAQ